MKTLSKFEFLTDGGKTLALLYVVKVGRSGASARVVALALDVNGEALSSEALDAIFAVQLGELVKAPCTTKKLTRDEEPAREVNLDPLEIA